MAFRLAADLTVAVHLGFVVLLLGGGFLAWRWPRLLLVHLPAVAVSAGLALAGLDCPLTDAEHWFRDRAGDATYRGGFVAHYLVRPLHPAGMTPTIATALRISTVAVVTVAYLGLLARRRAGTGPGGEGHREDVGTAQCSYVS